MKFGEIVPIVLKTLRSPVGRMTSHPDVNLSGSAMPPTPFKYAVRGNGMLWTIGFCHGKFSDICHIVCPSIQARILATFAKTCYGRFHPFHVLTQFNSRIEQPHVF